MKAADPRSWRLYTFLIAGSSLLILLGLHRAFYALMHQLSLPELLIAVLTGILNLGWYELGYVLGGALRSVDVFLSLPVLVSLTGILSVLFQYTRGPWSRRFIAMHIAFALAVSLLALLLLVARTVRGFPDPWRLVTALSGAALYLWWAFLFWRSRRARRVLTTHDQAT